MPEITPIIETIEITDLSRAGTGVGKLSTGQIVFVPETCPGDKVEVSTLPSSARYIEVQSRILLTPSTQRVVPPCPVFGKCGGCTWQHLPYTLQWKTKVTGLTHALGRVGIKELPDVEDLRADQIWEYRNRIQLHTENGQMGFYELGTKSIVEFSKCWIARPEINAEIAKLRQSPEIFEKLTTSPTKIEIEVLPDGTLKSYINAKHAAGGFRQVHDLQNHKLKAWVKKQLEPTSGDGSAWLLDLFGGSGNLSLDLSYGFHRIDCVDTGVPSLRPPSTPENFHFQKSAVKPWLQITEKRTGLKGQNQRTLAILDPPRIGLGDDFDSIEKSLRKLNTQIIIAVGCDTDSWAKDVSRFVKREWNLTNLGALDLFPQTPHLECLAVLYSAH